MSITSSQMANKQSLLLTISFLLLLSSCGPNKTNPFTSSNIKLDQYMIQGKDLFNLHCLNCHQADGSGLGKLIPPLNTTFVKEQKDLIICGIKHGLQGELTINGVKYNGLMPGNKRLTALEIAEIMTYISNTWGNDYGMVTIPEVEGSLSSCRK